MFHSILEWNNSKLNRIEVISLLLLLSIWLVEKNVKLGQKTMIENLLSLFIVQWRRESPIQTLSSSIDSKQQQNNVGQFIMFAHNYPT